MGERYKKLEEEMDRIFNEGYDVEKEQELINEAKFECDRDFREEQLRIREERGF